MKLRRRSNSIDIKNSKIVHPIKHLDGKPLFLATMKVIGPIEVSALPLDIAENVVATINGLCFSFFSLSPQVTFLPVGL